MMVVTPPVLPPSREPDSFPLPSGSSSALATPRQQERTAAFPNFQAPPPPQPFPVQAASSSTGPSLAQPRPQRLTPPDVVVKASMPPTPDPSPPTGKVLFPVQMVPIAPPADDAPRYVYENLDLGTSPASSSSSPSTNESTGSRGGPTIIDTNVPIVDNQRSPSPPKGGSGLPRSETQPNLSRASTTTATRTRQQSRVERDREQERPRTQRRSTMATSGTAGPASVRMQESRSADSRTRLRSTGGAKLMRYPTIANEHPSATARRDLRRLGVESSTPPRIFPGATSEVDNDLDYGGPDGLEAKVVLLGSQGVGKTSLILRLTTGSFSAIPAPASLDGSLYKRKLVHNGVPVKLQIWDTAGQERFRSMAPIYYRGAHVCILVYDITDRKSFQDVRSWLEELGGKASKDMLIYVVGAKIDLERQRAVTFGEARRTIRTWLKPPPPEPEGLPEVLSPTGRSLFRSTSTRARTDSSIGASPPRTRPHSMHGLASLMASVSDFADFDHSPASSQASTAAPTLVAPTPVPTVHFPASLTTSSGSASQSTSPIDRIQPLPRRQQRVSFHALQSPEMALPTFATTTETAVASTVNAGATATSRHNSSHRFSISGVLGLGRTTSVSEAVTNLASLAEANPVSVARSPTLRSPIRARTESSPMLGNDLPRKRSDDWTTNRAWGRGEGPRAADALEEFGANVRGGSADRSTAGTSAFSQSSNFPRPGRARGGSLGRDSRLYGSDDEDDAATPNEVQWGVEIEGIRLGEVSSLTGEGVEIMCRSISSALVERKDKIERERSLRRKNSVMLTDPSKNQAANKAKGRFGCCA